MKARIISVSLAVLLALLALPSIHAQEKPGSEPKPNVAPAPPKIPLKIQIVLTEFDGTQKISSLPYTMYTLAVDPHDHSREHLRLGVHLPVATASNASGGVPTQYTYIEVGTNIDCAAIALEDGQFSLDFTVEQSSASTLATGGKSTDWKPGDPNPGPQPITRLFRNEFALLMRDGQTMEGSSAVDPVTGHVLKINVTLNVLR